MTPSGRGQVRVVSAHLLLVEGKDEYSLVTKLTQRRLAESAGGVQIVEAGGRTLFEARIRAILQDAVRRKVTLRAVGVIRDADTNARAAWDSVHGALTRAGLQAPRTHGDFSNGRPGVGIFIVPDGRAPGAIETLCRQSVSGMPGVDCVERYLTCLKKARALESGNEDKSFTHAWLASRRDPVARVGEAALQGKWNFEHEAFAPLGRFIERLLDVNF